MTPPAPARPRDRSATIDAWRALACLAVVCFHAWANHAGPEIHPALAFVGLGARHGHLGVAVFFVLSGYCLAEAVERRAARGGGVLAFWQDRFLRIFPAYWAALALGLVLAVAALPFNGLPLASLRLADPSYWLANLALATRWTGRPEFLTVSWSLDYEIGFYLLVGLALLVPRASAAARLACYALLTLAAHLPGAAAHFPLLGLWPAFACGLAIRLSREPALGPLLRASLPLYPALLLALAPGLDARAAPAFALILLGSLALENKLPDPPRALVRLGLASYSIYLVHVPLMSPAANLARRLVSPASAGYLAVWGAQIALGVGGGLLFYAWVERRAEQVRARLRPRPAA